MLKSAVCAAHSDAIALIIRYGMTEYPDQDLEYTTLSKCIERHNHRLLQHWLECDASFSKTNADGQTLLFDAVQSDNLPCIIELVEHGMNIHSLNKRGENCLIAAARKTYLRIAAYLVEKGADPDTRSKDGVTARHVLLASFFAG